jgi:alkylation response protein AidB-like acyl-CoA dehydrogenase
MVWGTEEQKQKYLRPLLTGEKVTWQKLTEPKGGADLADYQSRAVRDGDDWILNGANVFIGGYEDAEMMVGPMLTDPDAPRHRNLGYFVIDIPSEGLDVKEMNLLGGARKRAIFMDNVRVSGDHLIGGETQGWQVLGTHLEFEHGGGGRAFPRDECLDDLMSFVKEAKHYGSDPVIRQKSMDAVIESHVQGLLAKRTHWMYQNKVEIRYEGNMANVHSRESGLRNEQRSREIMGMYSFLDTQEPGAPFGGAPDVRQRSAAGQRHPGGSTNIAKVVLSRRIGISRTQERPAPTPSTTSS